MLLCKIQPAFDHIGFAKVFADLRILRVEFHRLQVIADAFIGTSQFTRGVTAIVQRFCRVWLFQRVEQGQGFFVTPVLGQSIGIVGAVFVRHQFAGLPDATLGFAVEHLTFGAVGPDGRVVVPTASVGQGEGAGQRNAQQQRGHRNSKANIHGRCSTGSWFWIRSRPARCSARLM
ncbi:hypothetical protein D3C81_1529470 [compost metagenome]